MKSKDNKVVKVKTNKKSMSLKKLIKQYLARPVAFTVLVLTAAYGIKQMLNTLEDSIASILTVLFVLALVYIISDLD